MGKMNRRAFGSMLTAATVTPLVAQQTAKKKPKNPNAIPQNTSQPHREVPESQPPFAETIVFTRQPVALAVEPFPMTDVRLLPSVFKRAQDANLGYLRRLDPDRLLHMFRVNAGLPSNAVPLGGWEKPDCELRGHFSGGHILSAFALMYASTDDEEMRKKGDYMVAELAKCQQKLGGGYLSAFPLSFFDRLNAREKVWAPFYTVHKVMAGMFDMHQYTGNAQALEVLKGMADWADHWSAPIPEPHMQDVLNTEYGGMNEVLYNLAAVTGNDHYAQVGDRFTKKKFFNPLALRRDELRGLHVNTHIPQVIGAARRYELSGDQRFHDVADFFWHDVTSSRAYVTGGTSNGELWRADPNHQGAELKTSTDTNECCCAYNMLKLTRHLYQWNPDPRYFDYYERVIYNHRLGAIDLESGATQYYLSIVPAAWRTFNTENDSFWCCTGTGVEEFSKLNDSIYFHDANSLYVNLFIPSELNWKDKGLRLKQENDFPDKPSTVLTFEAAPSERLALHIRIPAWAGSDATLKINGKEVEAMASPGSYLTVSREWKAGDRLELSLPMQLLIEAMPDEPSLQAFVYGPLVLAGRLGETAAVQPLTIGPEGPDVEHHPMAVPKLNASHREVAAWMKPAAEPLTFEAENIQFVPYCRVPRERYSIYWSVSTS